MESRSSTQNAAGGRQRQAISAELRLWIVAQARAGVAPEQVLEAMKASGWQEDVAIEALEETLRGHLAERARAAPPAADPRPVPVPEPAIADSPSRIRVAGREVAVLMNLKLPRVVVFGGLLSDAECDRIVALAEPRMARSETVDNSTGGSEVNAARTSRGMFFERGETGVIDAVERRVAALLGWPVQNGEGLQVLHYTPGAEYKPHYDYFDPAHPGSDSILKRGGQRVGTLLMYLNTPEKGGGTTFPDIGLEVAPIKGNAVYFSYDRAQPATKSLHGGAPVIEGEKWVATKWLREREFV
ncbi:MAG: 2OG-Fe(II) oxygenase [Burkholderiaceae bacterium]